MAYIIVAQNARKRVKIMKDNNFLKIMGKLILGVVVLLFIMMILAGGYKQVTKVKALERCSLTDLYVIGDRGHRNRI